MGAARAGTAVGLALGTVLSLPGWAAGAAAATKRGPVHVFVTLADEGSHGKVTIAGFIGDYGTVRSIDKNGKPDPNGDFVQVTLAQGTFRIDSTRFDKATSNLRPTLYGTTCSGYAILHGPPVTLLAGTGRYAGISGSLRIQATFAFVAPRFTSGTHKGECNYEAAGPSPNDGYMTVTGAGTVTLPR